MMPNPIKRLWAANRPVLNGWLSVGNAFTAEIMATAGYDSLTVDLQHGVVDDHAALGMFQALRSSGVAIMARVPWLDPGAVMRVLDAGAYGVICPMINSPDEAARLVSYVRYPPRGTRSFGPTRANISAGPDYGAEADDEILCFAMIETREAYRRVAEIVATPGLDGVYVGPSDLTLGLTGRAHPLGLDREEPEMIEAIRHVLGAAHAAGIRAGLHTGTPAYAARAIDWGFDLVTVGTDVPLLTAAANATVAETRRRIGAAEKRPSPVLPSGGY